MKKALCLLLSFLLFTSCSDAVVADIYTVSTQQCSTCAISMGHFASIFHLTGDDFIFVDYRDAFLTSSGEKLRQAELFHYDIHSGKLSIIYASPEHATIAGGDLFPGSVTSAVDVAGDTLYFLELRRLSEGYQIDCMALRLSTFEVTRLATRHSGRYLSALSLSLTSDGKLIISELRSGQSETVHMFIDKQSGAILSSGQFAPAAAEGGGDVLYSASDAYVSVVGDKSYALVQKVTENTNHSAVSEYYLHIYSGDERIARLIDLAPSRISRRDAPLGIPSQLRVCGQYGYALVANYGYLFDVERSLPIGIPDDAVPLLKRAVCHTASDGSDRYMVFTNYLGDGDAHTPEICVLDTHSGRFSIYRFQVGSAPFFRFLAFDANLNAVVQIGAPDHSGKVTYETYTVSLNAALKP
ncbi:hypothetical protein LJC32_00800 [Oscillospiraceae bacterium OttesenSCG-928-F05]|nr:hypothetical protein [Oscillospiraceae bacterium OttesenSCG-928-F05]